MSRVLALLGAVLLVVAAIVVRTVLDDDDGGGDGGDGDRELVVACIPELRDACEAIDRPVQLQIEDPDATIARLAAGEDLDAWVTLDPWPAMAEILEDRATLGPVEPVARTELVLLARLPLAETCADPVTWTCVVDAGAAVAVPGRSSALGPLVLGQAAADFFGGDFAANDLVDPELTRRLDALELEGDPLADIRVGLPEPAATGVLAVQIDSLGARASAFDRSPSARQAAVAVVVAGRDADRVAGEPAFTEALRAAGWDVTADAATAGLPNAGVLVALRQAVR